MAYFWFVTCWIGRRYAGNLQQGDWNRAQQCPFLRSNWSDKHFRINFARNQSQSKISTVRMMLKLPLFSVCAHWSQKPEVVSGLHAWHGPDRQICTSSLAMIWWSNSSRAFFESFLWSINGRLFATYFNFWFRIMNSHWVSCPIASVFS